MTLTLNMTSKEANVPRVLDHWAAQVSPEEVETVLRDGIEYYIESALEPDFEQSDTDLYEPLPLEHVDETVGKLITKHERPAEASEVI